MTMLTTGRVSNGHAGSEMDNIELMVATAEVKHKDTQKTQVCIGFANGCNTHDTKYHQYWTLVRAGAEHISKNVHPQLP